MNDKTITHRAFQWFAGKNAVLPLLIGIVCTVSLGLFALWFAWFTGIVVEVAAGRQPDIAVRAPVTLYMMVGYFPMALYYLSHWSSRHLNTISRNFALDSGPFVFPRGSANWLGAAGAIVMYVLFLHQADDPFLLVQPGRWTADYPFVLVGLALMGWFNFRFMFLLISSALTVSRTARQIQHINLLDTSLVEPFAQQGVRSSLLAVVGLSISSNLWLDPNSPVIATATTLVMLVSATAAALFLPTWGIHQRLKTLKQTELKEIRGTIASRRELENRSVENAQQLRADLALEQRILDVSEWPFDAGSYARVILYVLLGLGSWVGAALVERVLDALN